VKIGNERKFVDDRESQGKKDKHQMLASGRRALHLKTPSQPPIWICRRCFHAQTRRNIQQQPEQPPDPSKTPVDRPLSPIEAFMKRYAKENKQPPIQQRSNVVVDSAPSFKPGAPSFSEIAEAYRKNVASKQCNDRASQKPKKETAKEKDDVAGSKMLYQELNRLDEMWDAGTNEVFEGEFMREDYQGAIALNGEEYVQKKFPFKQGDVVETKGCPPFFLLPC
jgi:hypothetical protein